MREQALLDEIFRAFERYTPPSYERQFETVRAIRLNADPSWGFFVFAILVREFVFS